MIPYLKMKDVSFSYNDQLVLDEVSLTINANDYIAITGHNGSGKSTLLQLLLGLIDPQKGTIERFGSKEYKWNKNDVGYIPQTGLTRLLSFPATVLEVILLQFPKDSYFSFYAKKNKAKAMEVLGRVNMQDFASKTLSSLSGGQLQRVLIAKELMKSPKLLFLDEPTNGLDQKSIQEMYQLLDNLHKNGVTILIVTHHLDSLDQRVNRIVNVDYHRIEEVR